MHVMVGRQWEMAHQSVRFNKFSALLQFAAHGFLKISPNFVQKRRKTAK